MQQDRISTAAGGRRRYVWWLGSLAVVLLLGAIWHGDLGARLPAAVRWISGLGPLGYVLFVLLYVAACVVLVPASVLTLGAGAVYGLGEGIVISSTAATLGASVAFLLGRHLARERVVRKLEAYPRFQMIDRAVARDGWKIVFMTRLSPMFPFVLLNYAYGVTGVSFREFFFASWLGMLPGTVLYVYLGSLAREVASASAHQQRERTAGEWALYAVGLLATVAVTVYVTRLARRALRARTEEAPADSA
jgi:uncharacterized membrane protein YdjX (TVP38/TMEM64 family)